MGHFHFLTGLKFLGWEVGDSSTVKACFRVSSGGESGLIASLSMHGALLPMRNSDLASTLVKETHSGYQLQKLGKHGSRSGRRRIE